MTIILGIDPGTNITGYGLIDISSGLIKYIHHSQLRLQTRNLLSTYTFLP